jgi:hypothetical protein
MLDHPGIAAVFVSGPTPSRMCPHNEQRSISHASRGVRRSRRRPRIRHSADVHEGVDPVADPAYRCRARALVRLGALDRGPRGKSNGAWIVLCATRSGCLREGARGGPRRGSRLRSTNVSSGPLKARLGRVSLGWREYKLRRVPRGSATMTCRACSSPDANHRRRHRPCVRRHGDVRTTGLAAAAQGVLEAC